MKYFILPLLIFSLVSCSTSPHLEVTNQYWSRKDLASFIVNTPDPSKNDPIFGQRLIMSWSVSKKTFDSGPLELLIKVKLKNNEQIDQIIPLKETSGSYYFPIYGDDFTKKGGLLSYFVELKSNGETIGVCRHKLWVEPIIFSS